MANKELYLMQDGTYAAPGDLTEGKDGVLRSKTGLQVALKNDGTPQSLQSIADTNTDLQDRAFGDKAKDEGAADEGDDGKPAVKTPVQPITTATMAPKPKADDKL